MTKLETDLDSKPSSTPIAVKRPNRPSIASNNSSSSQSGPAKRKCVDPLEAGPSGSAKEEFVTIPDEDENNAVAPKMEPEFVNESMWDDDEDGTNNDETNFGEDDSNMEMTGFDGSTTGDGNLTGGEGGAVGDAQGSRKRSLLWKYFKDLGDPLVRCKLCKNTLSGNKARHLRGRHPRAYEEMQHNLNQQQQESLNEITFVSTSKQALYKRRSYEKYMTDVDADTKRCNVCKNEVKYYDIKRHIQTKHPDIFENENAANYVENTDTVEEIDKTQEDDVRRTSHMWIHFKYLGNSCLSCTLCSSEVNDMAKHLKENHYQEYLCLQHRDSMKDHGWVRKYTNKLGVTQHECDLCKVVLHIQPGFKRNLLRHFKLVHPYIYTKERSLIIDSDDGETNEVKRDSFKAGTETATSSKYRSWVRKYFTRVGPKDHQCQICKCILHLKPEFTGNLLRHFKLKHPHIYAKETNRNVIETEKDHIIKAQRKRGWVKKYSTKIGDSEKHQCNLCKQVLICVLGLSNMRRHFKSKHPTVYAKENIRYEKELEYKLEEKDDNKQQQAHEEITEELLIDENGEQYIVEYLLEGSPADSSTYIENET